MNAARTAWRTRHDPWKAAFFAVAVIALVVGVAWALLGSSLLVVRSVKTIGAGHIPRSQVLAAAGISVGTPLIRIDPAVIARRVERITQVQVARVTRSWPDAVVIWTMRRTAVFAVPVPGGGYDRVDPFGVILGTAAARPAGLVPLRVPGKTASELHASPAVRAAGIVLLGLPPWLRGKLAAMRAAAPTRITLLLRDGDTVLWGGTGRPGAKAKEMSVLLRTGARYYDVSDPATAVTGRPG